MQENITPGVKTLLGDPRRAIVKLSVPMIIGMLVQTFYNLVDGIWVAGLGSDALAAIGLFFPFFMVIISLATGIGIGGSSVLARKIGAKDRKGASNTAIHTILIGFLIGTVLTAVSLPFLKEIFSFIGAKGDVVKLSIDYARVLFGGAFVVFFTNIAGGILRGEGDTKRAMYAMILGSILNIILDPIFIYTMKMGVLGAAWATLLSMITSSILVGYWILVKRDTYVDIAFKNFKPSKDIIKKILRVGIPSSLAQLSMAAALFFLNVVIVKTAGGEGVAVFTSAWRIVMFGVVPLLGIATGTVAVVAAAYGAKDIEKLETGYLYAVKLGILIEMGVMVLIITFAPQITHLFTYSEGSAQISGELTNALRKLTFFLPTVPFGMITSSMFQGIGHGEKSLVVTILRTIIMQVLFAYFFALIFDLGLNGVWLGIVLGNVIAAGISFSWGRITVNQLKNKFQKNS